MRTLTTLAFLLTAACGASPAPSTTPATTPATTQVAATSPTSATNASGTADGASTPASSATGKGRYAKVNGLDLYYEVHGSGDGRPIVLLHGAFCTIEGCFGELVPALAEHRQVIAVEMQGHGRTADIDRPLRANLLASDIDALLESLSIPQADVLGYSMGSAVALQFVLDFPQRAGKVVLVSPSFNRAGAQPGLYDMMAKLEPEIFYNTPMHEGYAAVAPRPEDFPRLVARIKDWSKELQDVPAAKIKALPHSFLLVAGDGDMSRPEHVIELFRLVGGGHSTDMTGPGRSQLAILPNTSHYGIVSKQKELATITNAFLDAAPAATLPPQPAK